MSDDDRRLQLKKTAIDAEKKYNFAHSHTIGWSTKKRSISADELPTFARIILSCLENRKPGRFFFFLKFDLGELFIDRNKHCTSRVCGKKASY